MLQFGWTLNDLIKDKTYKINNKNMDFLAVIIILIVVIVITFFVNTLSDSDDTTKWYNIMVVMLLSVFCAIMIGLTEVNVSNEHRDAYLENRMEKRSRFEYTINELNDTVKIDTVHYVIIKDKK